MPLPLGFVPPCLPTKAPQPPTGEAWLHEIKHDGFRVVARKDGTRIKLYSRPGNDLTYRFTLIVEALSRLRSRSCIIDGEAVCCDDNGMPSFDRIRYRRHDASVFLYAFDLIELDGDDLRREPFETRKATLASLLKRAAPGLRLNEHIEADGPDVFAHACKMGLEGIVSKRKTSPYRSGRSPDWIKSKNPACEAVRREAEEDWGDVSICQGVRIVSAIVVVRIQRNENREWCRGHSHGNFATNDGYCYAWRQSGTNHADAINSSMEAFR